MPLIQRVLEIYRNEGMRTLLQKSVEYITNKISPKPTVANDTTPHIYWFLKYIYNFVYEWRHGAGIDVMSEDWDTLILLDACRFDDFQRLNTLNGELKSKISKGVDSKEFINKNFVGKDLSETVYVTANPHVTLVDDDVFHDIVTEPLSNWNSNYQCVLPEKVTKTAIKAHERYPNKRIIVHYMQPHDPPLGPTADSLRSDFQIDGPKSNGGKRIMELVAGGEIPEERAHKAYRETLEIVLNEVEELVESISGKVVVSSDHGEMFGEEPYYFIGKLYEHYRNPKTQELCKVPWFIVDTNSYRRKIAPENTSSENQNRSDEKNIEKQLEALGYK